MLAGITRVRNEELILEDTIRHMLAIVDHIYLYDDYSTDRTVEIATSFDRVTVTQGHEHRSERAIEETRHRRMMLEQARRAGHEWCLCFDADERIVGDMPSMDAASPSGYRFQLFDGYMTKECSMDYEWGDLSQLPRMWGPEKRNILMLFRICDARYMGEDQREPVVRGSVDTTAVYVKHYGKCISIQQFEDTCRYYMAWEKYSAKWAQRLKEGAVHTVSDFGRTLYTWDELMVRPELHVNI